MTIEPLEELNRKWRQRYPGLAKLHFSDWVSWEERNTIPLIDKVGVYILAKYEPNDLPKSVNPLDRNVIYVGKTNIGKTTSIKNRLTAFDNAAFGSGKAHHAGGETYRERFKTDKGGIHVSICPIYWLKDQEYLSSEDSENFVSMLVTRLEVCLRGVYVLRWGRLPQLNKE